MASPFYDTILPDSTPGAIPATSFVSQIAPPPPPPPLPSAPHGGAPMAAEDGALPPGTPAAADAAGNHPVQQPFQALGELSQHQSSQHQIQQHQQHGFYAPAPGNFGPTWSPATPAYGAPPLAPPMQQQMQPHPTLTYLRVRRDRPETQ